MYKRRGEILSLGHCNLQDSIYQVSPYSIFPYLLIFNVSVLLLYQYKVFLPFALIIVTTELRVLQQSSFHSSLAMSRHRTLCHDKNALSALSSACCFIATYSCWLQHSSLIYWKFCQDRQKLCHDRDCCNFHFFLLLLCWNYLIFQLTLAKHKVDEYSII